MKNGNDKQMVDGLLCGLRQEAQQVRSAHGDREDILVVWLTKAQKVVRVTDSVGSPQVMIRLERCVVSA